MSQEQEDGEKRDNRKKNPGDNSTCYHNLSDDLQEHLKKGRGGKSPIFTEHGALLNCVTLEQ